MNDKAALRRRMKALRDVIPEIDRQAFSRYIAAQAADIPQAGDMVFVYSSVGSEVQTGGLIRALWDKGCRVCLPRITGKGRMEAVEYRLGEELQSDRYGIPTPTVGEFVPPEEVSIAFVPALAFDDSGNRLGYGGGYYDRWLARSGARRVLLAYASQRVDPISVEEWDVPMDAMVTERGMTAFR